jgi:hypothetical protein
MTVYDLLYQCESYLSVRSQWTRCREATDEWGISVPFNDPNAQKFCALGAVCRFNRGSTSIGVKAVSLLRRAALQEFHAGVTMVNDALGHEAVLLMFQRARYLALNDSTNLV